MTDWLSPPPDEPEDDADAPSPPAVSEDPFPWRPEPSPTPTPPPPLPPPPPGPAPDPSPTPPPPLPEPPAPPAPPDPSPLPEPPAPLPEPPAPAPFPVDPVPPAPIDPVPPAPTSSFTPVEDPTLTAAYDTPPAPTIESLPAPEPEPDEFEVAEIDLPEASAHSGVLDEVAFDTAHLSVEQRRHLSMRLTGAGITHRFEVGTDLVVGLSDADVIEGYLEEVQNPDGFDVEELDAFEEDNDVDDEAVYSAMSNLYVAADKLMQRPGDGPSQGTFYLAADDVEGLPAPFGFDPRVWAQVLGLTDSIVAKLDAVASENDIEPDVRSLRQLLVNYV